MAVAAGTTGPFVSRAGVAVVFAFAFAFAFVFALEIVEVDEFVAFSGSTAAAFPLISPIGFDFGFGFGLAATLSLTD